MPGRSYKPFLREMAGPAVLGIYPFISGLKAQPCIFVCGNREFIIVSCCLRASVSPLVFPFTPPILSHNTIK